LTYETLERYRDARRVYEGYLSTCRAQPLCTDLKRRLALLDRRELEVAAREALARESEIADTPPRTGTVAVFPFRVLLDDPTLRPLGRAVAELLVNDLSQTRRVTVLERLQVQVLVNELKLATSGLVDPMQAVRSGRILGAERIVQGSLGGQADELELSAAIVNVGSATLMGGAGVGLLSETDAMNRILQAQKRLALRIYQSLGVELTVAERERVSRRPTGNLQAILAFGAGLEAMDRGDYTQAAQDFTRAVQMDPTFTMARRKSSEARETASAASVSMEQLIERAGIESAQPGSSAADVLMPNPFARDPVAEVLGNETVGRKAIIELIFRRPNE
jgi:TolB-like protein